MTGGALVGDDHARAIGEQPRVTIGIADGNQPDAAVARGGPGVAVSDALAFGDVADAHQRRDEFRNGAEFSIHGRLAGGVDAVQADARADHVVAARGEEENRRGVGGVARGFSREMRGDAIKMLELFFAEKVAGHIRGDKMGADAHQSQRRPMLHLVEQFQSAFDADPGAGHAGVDHHLHVRPSMHHAGDAGDIVGGGLRAQHQVPVVSDGVFDARRCPGEKALSTG